MIQNPFTFGPPIQDPARFFGRKEVIQQIFNLLNSGHHISIVGERRIGKTSLLTYISNPEVFTKYLDPCSHIFVFIDFQKYNKDSTVEDFWRTAMRGIERQLNPGEYEKQI